MFFKILAVPGMTDIIVQLVVFVVSAVLTPKVWQYIKLKADDKTRGYLETAIEGAIRAGINAIAKQQNRTPMALLLAVVNDHQVREQVMAFAKDYLHRNTPVALQRLGITDNLADIITARLDNVVENMAATIAGTATAISASYVSPIPVEHTAVNMGVLGSDKPTATPPRDENDADPVLDLTQPVGV
jgi:hypothetical protein